MDYAHAYANLIASQKPTDAVKEWVEAQNRPYAKLMRGFESSVNDILSFRGFDYSLLPRITEIAVFTYSDNPLAEDENGAIDNLRSGRKVLISATKDLWKLGCPAWHPWPHSYVSDDGQERYNLCLAMPLQKPNESFGHETIGMPPQPRTLPNFEGQVTFLAYLMRKGYVTDADAPRGENPAAPFSAAMFGFAKTRALELKL